MLILNKKASLELSIRAIVIVVLAMTLLGLGLGFVRNMFKDIGELTSDVTENIRQRILDDLITGDKKISFPKTQILIDKGGSTVMTVGIRNKLNNPLAYKMIFSAKSGPNEFGITGDITPGKLDAWFQYGKAETYTLLPADSEVRNIRLEIPRRANSGSYFLTFDIIDQNSGSTYAQKDFFIVVRG